MKNYYGFGDFLWQLFLIMLQVAAFWAKVFINKLIAVFIGAFFGWIVGWFLETTILGILAQIGITGYSMWQIGAFLGFVGSFFGSNVNISRTDVTPRREARY